jgi:hypothetical protein
MPLKGRSAPFTALTTNETVWYWLTVELSLLQVLAFQLLAEVALVCFFAALLWGLGQVDCTQAGCETFADKLLLSLATVRLGSDASFGWQLRARGSAGEVALLALESWAHWVTLLGFAAVVLARALEPHRQVCFAPTARIDADEVLEVRLAPVRTGVTLVRPLIKLEHCSSSGKYTALVISSNRASCAVAAGAGVTTLKHKIDRSSPLHSANSGRAGTAAVIASVTAQDGRGTPVFAATTYAAAAESNGPACERLVWLPIRSTAPHSVRENSVDNPPWYRSPPKSANREQQLNSVVPVARNAQRPSPRLQPLTMGSSGGSPRAIARSAADAYSSNTRQYLALLQDRVDSAQKALAEVAWRCKEHRYSTEWFAAAVEADGGGLAGATSETGAEEQSELLVQLEDAKMELALAELEREAKDRRLKSLQLQHDAKTEELARNLAEYGACIRAISPAAAAPQPDAPVLGS